MNAQITVIEHQSTKARFLPSAMHYLAKILILA